MRRILAGGFVLITALAACGDSAKEPSSKASAFTAVPAEKAGSARTVVAAELSSAFAAHDESKGISSIGPNQTVDGVLDSSDGTRDNGAYYDAWVFRLFEDASISIEMNAENLDAYVTLFRGEPGQLGTQIAYDDDSGPGLNSLLETSLEAGTYTALATTWASADDGNYTFTLNVEEGAGGGGGSGLRPGVTQSAELDGTEVAFDDGGYFDEWAYDGQAGERIVVTMNSTEVDPLVILVRGSSVDGEYMTEDDDSGPGLDARMEYVLPTTGRYTIIATTWAAGDTGAYEITVESQEGAAYTFDNAGDADGKYALVVGIDDYPGFGSDLRGPVEDARIMRNALVERFGFDPENVVMLTDSDATRENIANGIVQHLGQAGPDGIAVFFYSGHGTQMGANIGLTGSLDPEPRGEGDEALYIYGLSQESSVILDEELGYLMETLEAGRSLVVVDACFAGEITRAAGDAPQSKVVDLSDPEVAENLRLPTNFIGVEPKVTGELTDMTLGFGELASFAEVFSRPQRHVMWGGSTEDQVSWTSGLGNGASVFTYYLGERLMSAPLTATLSQVHEDVASDVVRYISGNDNMTMQNPQMRGNNMSMTLADFFGVN